jgi:hypothetical protein
LRPDWPWISLARLQKGWIGLEKGLTRLRESTTGHVGGIKGHGRGLTGLGYCSARAQKGLILFGEGLMRSNSLRPYQIHVGEDLLDPLLRGILIFGQL